MKWIDWQGTPFKWDPPITMDNFKLFNLWLSSNLYLQDHPWTKGHENLGNDHQLIVIDCRTNSPPQNYKKCIENSIKNICILMLGCSWWTVEGEGSNPSLCT